MSSRRSRRSPEGVHTCYGCGDTVINAYAHPFCATATPEDWSALMPYFKGTLRGVDAAGA